MIDSEYDVPIHSHAEGFLGGRVISVKDGQYSQIELVEIKAKGRHAKPSHERVKDELLEKELATVICEYLESKRQAGRVDASGKDALKGDD